MRLLFGEEKTVADWASAMFGHPLRNWYFAQGIVDKAGVLRGAATWHDMNGSNIELCFYGPGAMSADIARALMRFAFDEIKVNRISAKTQRGNKIIARALPSFGFRFEGIARRYYGPTKKLDAVMFGLLADDARKFIGVRE